MPTTQRFFVETAQVRCGVVFAWVFCGAMSADEVRCFTWGRDPSMWRMSRA